MKIVKSTQTIEFTCVKCGSILEVEPTDVRTSDSEHSSKVWFTCPVCGVGNPLDGKIPESWIPIIYKDKQSKSL